MAMPRKSDWLVLYSIVITTTLFGAYFFHGGGWNQNSHFDLIRALVEDRSGEITRFASNTGDVSVRNERVFSNKPPGLAFLGIVPYAIFSTALPGEESSPVRLTALAHIISIIASALPLGIVGALLFVEFVRVPLAKSDAFLLASLYGMTTLALPYAGTLVSHNLTACLLLTLYSFPHRSLPLSPRFGFLMGVVAAYAAMTDYLASLPAAYLLIRCILRTSGSFLPPLFGFSIPVSVLLLYNALLFGSPLTSSYAHTSPIFLREGLVLGLFEIPVWERIFYLTFHPFKGLFIVSPIFLLTLLSIIPRAARPDVYRSRSTALLVCVYFLVTTMAMRTWTGGWGVGVRYLIPALPFAFLFLSSSLQYSRTIFWALAIPSVLVTFGVAAVGTFMPSPNTFPIAESWPWRNPWQWSLHWLIRGAVSINTQGMLDPQPTALFPGGVREFWKSYNLGELIGLRGVWSLLPLLVPIAWVGAVYRHLRNLDTA